MSAGKPKKKKQQEFINREISWLAFNDRVLQEAQERENPLISRMRFLGIFSNNMDEFFRVRVATLRRAKTLKSKAIDPMDFDPGETLTHIYNHTVLAQKRFEKTFQEIVNELKKESIHFINETQLGPEQKKFAEEYFEEKVRPNLVPLMLHNNRPFPSLSDTSIYLAIELGYRNRPTHPSYALIEIPSHLPRFLEFPQEGKKRFVMFIEDIIRYRLRKVFGIFDFDQARAFAFKITRDAELDIDDDLSKSLVDKMSRSLSQRKKGEYVRINYDQDMPAALLQFILKKTKITDIENIIPGGRYHNKRDLLNFPDFGRKDLILPVLSALPHPQLAGKKSIMDEMKNGDILLHFPYHSFTTVLDLIREAAIDPHVRTIRISIYRLAKDSQVLNALINAARNGKRVVAVVEVQARFDEANNIAATQALMEAGARVIPGVTGLKVHSKLLQISRREHGRTARYTHIGSGNFHERTASVYTDVSLLTANREIGKEVRKIFEFFELNFTRHQFRHLLVSPFNARRRFIELINQEIEWAEKGKPATITIKMNNLVDAAMIRKLYEASQAGVQIRMIIRGICSLIPGVKGMSENITVTSVVGRFLEHSRIIVFGNGGKPLYFISSADWMTRNLDYRIEVTTPVLDTKLKKQLQDTLDLLLSPDVRARRIDASMDNKFTRNSNGTKGFDGQVKTYEYFRGLK